MAELLIPKDHGFGTRRVPMKTNYFEAFNLDNVHQIDLNKTAIEEIMPEGIRCSDKLYELDLIIYATGFDAVPGALKRIDISGKGGQKLTAKWEDEWTQHVDDLAQKTLFPTADSWFMGVNPNNPDAKRTFMLYAGGAPHYKAKCDDAAHHYEGFALK